MVWIDDYRPLAHARINRAQQQRRERRRRQTMAAVLTTLACIALVLGYVAFVLLPMADWLVGA